jgi:hypothetical protein|tara:strand:- start:643 stop:1119 length:477 start_codon:yes stop_codon:yes gene_type:complete
MIKLSDLIETKKLKIEIPQDPFDTTPDPNEPIPDDESDIEDWKDEDDMNMSDEEFEEFQNELNSWLENNRIKDLTNEMIDTTDLIIDFILMSENQRNILGDMSDEEQKKISNILRKKRLKGLTSGMWKDVGIKYLGDNGLWSKMLDWEKEYYDKHHKS